MEESKYKDITDKVISATMQVHRELSSGYGDTKIGTQLLNFLIEDAVAVELKAIPKLEDVHIAEAISNSEAFHLEFGLLINHGGISL